MAQTQENYIDQEEVKMAKRYYQTFTVESNFSFPIDMLRYDGCFPASEVDSGVISRSLTDFERPVKVKIGRWVHGKGYSEPTIGRWESFGCKVSEINTI